MTLVAPQSVPPAAHVLAMVVAANGRVDPKEVGVLDRLDGFQRLGVPRDDFLALAGQCVQALDNGRVDRSWLQPDTLAHLFSVVDAVQSPQERLLVCRLAAAVMTADGSICSTERRVYRHALLRWGISDDMVSHAILHDRAAGSDMPPR